MIENLDKEEDRNTNTSIQAEQELFWIAGKQEIVIRDNRNDSDDMWVPCKIESK